jgi:uncharacterized membrane protein (UPF0127 family)
MRLAATVVLAALLILAGPPAHAQLQKFDTSSLTITTAKGAQRFAIELALTPAQQEQGLMFRRELAPDAGMLFVFPQTLPTAFWMKNTLIPLDMLFIAADGRIADIHERAVPLTEANIPAKMPVKAVLELNGGTVARLGIKVGDVVHHAAFRTAG